MLAERGLLARKGAPETFDVGRAGARPRARSVPAARAVAVPVFDRGSTSRGPRRGLILPGQELVLVEGNYLLLDAAPWDALAEIFDRTVLLEAGAEELRRRLVRRWLEHGLDRPPPGQGRKATTCPMRGWSRKGRAAPMSAGARAWKPHKSGRAHGPRVVSAGSDRSGCRCRFRADLNCGKSATLLWK